MQQKQNLCRLVEKFICDADAYCQQKGCKYFQDNEDKTKCVWKHLLSKICQDPNANNDCLVK